MKARASLDDLAMIGNGQVAFLVDSCGSISWGCWPRLDGDPMFCSLLSGDPLFPTRGVFAIELMGQSRSDISYLRNTAIVESTLSDDRGGTVRVTDFCPRFRRYGRMFRPAMLVRIVEPVGGRPIVRVRLSPASANGSRTIPGVPGSHHIAFGDARLTTDASLTYIEEHRWFVLDRPLHLIFGPNETLDDSPAAVARSFLDASADYWREWVRSLSVPSEWQEAVIRAAITLKLCAFEDTGAIIAAPTTSIPESPGSARNWDYRYCWLRDAYFTVQALNRLGATRTMEAFMSYIDALASSSPESDLQPVYGISNEAALNEIDIPALPGYRGDGPVRIGNSAFAQSQHDAYGSVILASTQAYFDERLARPGDRVRFERLETLGERAAQLFDTPDAGLWELRGRHHRHTFSAAMCWAACDRLARIAARLGLAERESAWRHRAQGLSASILARSWHAGRESLSSDLDEFSLDASLLLLPELGLISWNDERFLSTMARIEKDLMSGGYVMRYRHEDDFGAPTHAFLACSFWWVHALAATGRAEEARERFNHLLGIRNRVGLLSEHIDPATAELWGNFPQSYSLVGIITSALRLSRPWEDML